MKRLIRLIAFGCLLSVALAVVAEESDIFVKTIPITKIYSHKLGYKIVYPAGGIKLAEIYVPAEWFDKAGAKGEVIWGDHPAFPYMSIFWQNGQFHHIRLFLEKNRNAATWGSLADTQDFSQKFNTDTLSLQ